LRENADLREADARAMKRMRDCPSRYDELGSGDVGQSITDLRAAVPLLDDRNCTVMCLDWHWQGSYKEGKTALALIEEEESELNAI
jgi:hypothetical protein